MVPRYAARTVRQTLACVPLSELPCAWVRTVTMRQYEHPVRHGRGTAYMSTRDFTEASRERNLTTREWGGAGGWRSAISRVEMVPKRCRGASPQFA